MDTVTKTLGTGAVQEVVTDGQSRAGVGVIGDARQASDELLALTVTPFLVEDAAKIVLALLLIRTVRKTSLGRS